MRIQQARVLNDNSLLFGLNQNDFLSLSLLFPILQLVLVPMGGDLIGVILISIATIILMVIRLTNRRHIIRDYLSFLYFRFLWGGFYGDPKNHS